MYFQLKWLLSRPKTIEKFPYGCFEQDSFVFRNDLITFFSKSVFRKDLTSDLNSGCFAPKMACFCEQP